MKHFEEQFTPISSILPSHSCLPWLSLFHNLYLSLCPAKLSLFLEVYSLCPPPLCHHMDIRGQPQHTESTFILFVCVFVCVGHCRKSPSIRNGRIILFVSLGFVNIVVSKKWIAKVFQFVAATYQCFYHPCVLLCVSVFQLQPLGFFFWS